MTAPVSPAARPPGSATTTSTISSASSATVPIDRAKLIAVDGVYGMSGELAPLPEIVALKHKYGARLLVDDAHGTGVLGENGRGTPEFFGVEDEVDLHGGTFAKSFGTFGGYMCGPKNVIEFMRFQSQGYVLTKALPAAITAATIKTLELIQRMPERRKKLWENLDMLRAGLREGRPHDRQSARRRHLGLGPRHARATRGLRARAHVRHHRQPRPLPGGADQHLDHPRHAVGDALARLMSSASSTPSPKSIAAHRSRMASRRSFRWPTTGDADASRSGAVETAADWAAFHALRPALYRDDPAFVRPLAGEARLAIDTARHPFWQHAERQAFLARRNGRVVGRVAAIIDRLHNEHYGDRTGFFGFFECEDDPEAARALLKAAADWLAARGLERSAARSTRR